ncbi:MAG: hypothetical protein OEV35_04780 [Gallionellaceae bacterium]|nr:hypothetical protein [Gallionellaceae bacterium]
MENTAILAADNGGNKADRSARSQVVNVLGDSQLTAMSGRLPDSTLPTRRAWARWCGISIIGSQLAREINGTAANVMAKHVTSMNSFFADMLTYTKMLEFEVL